MSTTGIQNYLSNVFRQVYTYDTTAALFTPRLELSNIDTYSGNMISVATAAVGDTASNVYVGSNAGNPYNFIQNDRNVTAVGFGAARGISNSSNSVYLGFQAGAGTTGANAVIAIGVSAIGGGTSNIFIGNGTGTVGSSNIFIGHSIAPVGVSNQIRIGISNQIVIAGDLSRGWVGIGGILNPADANNKVDVSGNMRIQGDLGIRRTPGGRTLDVSGTFRVNNGLVNLDLSGNTVAATFGDTTMSVTETVGGGLFRVLSGGGVNLSVSSALGVNLGVTGTNLGIGNRVLNFQDSFGTQLYTSNRLFQFSDTSGTQLEVSNGIFKAGTSPGTQLEVGDRLFRFTDPSGTQLQVSSGVTTSPGYTSIQLSLTQPAGSYVVAPFKRGLMLVSVADVVDPTNRAAAIIFAFGPTSAILSSIHQNGTLSFTVGTGQLVLAISSGPSRTYPISVTYFPLPF